MRLSDFDYVLPKKLISQSPLAERSASRLLVMHRGTKKIEHLYFKDISIFLEKDDVLVLNDTKVFKARLFGKREGFEGKIELLLTEKKGGNTYLAIARPSCRLKDNTKLIFEDKKLTAQVIGNEDEFKLIRFNANGNLGCILEEIGQVPLPPYIKRKPNKEDEQRYQTVYAKNIGAIAAPTAGLHFTEGVLDNLKKKGVSVSHITLHVGYATFKPVKEQDITRHRMHREYFEISKEAAEKINNARNKGGRVIAVGTTSCRAIESAVLKQANGNRLISLKSWTDLFIYPGFKFRTTDILLTNFHLPRSSLLMLVCAFAGKENVFRAYNEAVERNYRFYSYGDAMLII